MESLVGLGRVINDRPESQTAFVPGFRHTRTHAFATQVSPSVSGVRVLSSEHQNTEVICLFRHGLRGGFFLFGNSLSVCGTASMQIDCEKKGERASWAARRTPREGETR